jgi:Ca2+-binding RTX toxin-like protein
VVFGANTGQVDVPGTSGNDMLTGNGNANILIGGLGNDTLNGGAGNDRLTGGLGNDTLVGGLDNDLYRINRGDGQDTISENDGTLGNSDKLLYGDTINPINLVISKQANDLRIALHGSTDSVTIQDWYTSANSQVETIQAGNGQVLLSTQVDGLIQAMATFVGNNGYTSWDQAIDQNPQGVQSVLAANGWHNT